SGCSLVAWLRPSATFRPCGPTLDDLSEVASPGPRDQETGQGCAPERVQLYVIAADEALQHLELLVRPENGRRAAIGGLKRPPRSPARPREPPARPRLPFAVPHVDPAGQRLERVHRGSGNGDRRDRSTAKHRCLGCTRARPVRSSYGYGATGQARLRPLEQHDVFRWISNTRHPLEGACRPAPQSPDIASG